MTTYHKQGGYLNFKVTAGVSSKAIQISWHAYKLSRGGQLSMANAFRPGLTTSNENEHIFRA
jgi:hypothetical protein